MQSWIASGLGSCLNHVEEAFGQLFRLRGWPDEYLELNTAALLRWRTASASRVWRAAYQRHLLAG